LEKGKKEQVPRPCDLCAQGSFVWRLPWCTCVSASARQSRAQWQCCARGSFVVKFFRLWVWSATSRGRPHGGGLALAGFHMVPRGTGAQGGLWRLNSPAPDKGDTTADRLAARSARYTDWRVAVSSQSIVSTVTNEVQFLVPCPVSDLQRPESDPRVPSRLGQPPPGPAPWILHLAFGVPFRGGEHAAHERRMVATQFV